MAKIFLYLSLAVILATAALGFMSKQRVDSVKNALNSSKASEKVARDQATKLSGDLKETKGSLEAANKTVEEQKTKITQTESDLAVAKTEAEKAKGDVDAKDKEIAALNDKIKGIPQAPSGVPDAANQSRIDELTKQVDETKKALLEAQQVSDTLKTRDHESSEKLASTERELARYKQNGYRAGITGRVVAVNKGWNFVVIDVGDRRGSAVNAPLLVKRGGQQVARLRVTSVEPGTSIADVIPGSMIRGETVQLGDTVVFAGRQPGPADQPQAPGAQPAVQPPTTGAAAPQAQNL